MNAKTLIVVVAVSVVTGGWLYKNLTDEPQTAVRVEKVNVYLPAPASPAAEPEIEPSLNAGLAPSGAATPPQRPADFGQQFLGATDLKAYVIDALKRPQEGGAFYAALALRECSRGDLAYMKAEAAEVLQKVSAKTTTVTAEQMKAINAAADRCVNFSEGEVRAYADELMRVRDDDPLAQLQTRAMSRDATERDKARAAILETGNLTLMSEARVPTVLLQAAIDNLSTGMVYRYEGKTYADENDQRALDNGAWLATCGPGPCQIDREMRIACVAQGDCYGSREGYLRQQVFKDDPKGYEHAIKVSEQVRAALLRKDTSIFR